MRNRFYEFIYMFVGPIIRIFFPYEIEGKENLPEQPAVLCANHSHASDPILLFLAFGKNFKMRFMAKKELFAASPVRWFLKNIGAFPVDRGNNDVGAIKASIRCIKDGCNLLIFPEGTRVKEPGSIRAHRGAMALAIQTGVDVLPIFIDTKRKLFNKTKIIVGKLYHPVYTQRKGTPEEQQSNMDTVMKTIYSLGGYNEG